MFMQRSHANVYESDEPSTRTVQRYHITAIREEAYPTGHGRQQQQKVCIRMAISHFSHSDRGIGSCGRRAANEPNAQNNTPTVLV